MLATEKNTSKDNNNFLCKETAVYHVRNRDTLCRIAVNYNTTTSNLMKLNKLSSTLIFPGQVLLIPLMKDEVDKTDETNNDLPIPIANTMDDAYAFLAPLSPAFGCSSSLSSPKPFKELSMVFTEKPENHDTYKSRKVPLNSVGIVQCSAMQRNHVKVDQTAIPRCFEDNNISKSDVCRGKRLHSIESSSSEPFEENFLKLNVHYLTVVLEHVHGILLITPSSIMFDPDPTCPLSLEHGCEKFGVMVDMKNIVTLTMYRDTGYTREDEPLDEFRSTSLIDENVFSANDMSDAVNHVDKLSADGTEPTSDTFALDHDLVTISLSASADNNGLKEVKANDNSKIEPWADRHSSGKNEPVFEPEVLDQEKEAATSLSNMDKVNFMYFCVRSNEPIMKTFSVLSALDECNDEPVPHDEVSEAWFHVPKRNSDQVMAFFMQWSPDPYALDFAEQNGFVLAETLEPKKKKKEKKIRPKNEDTRSRSSTSSSSSSHGSSSYSSLEQSTEEFVGNRKVEKEWELVSIEEAKRRTELNANELANDDTSLIPELLNTSNLIKDDTLLELCKRMSARCIGCPWKLLYSTSEHGMSLRTLYRKMTHMCSDDDSPAFILIRDTEGHIFGAFSSSRPHLSEHFYGSGESFLFTLEPELEFFEWAGENHFFIKGGSDALVFGGGDGTAGLWIDGDLRQGRSRPCLTFRNSVLSSTEDFFIQDIEVWGFEDS